MGASRDGERVGLYYSLAWFDRYLKGATTAHGRGDEAAQAADARARLQAATFDDSVDGSSIGTGFWDPAQARNVPYTVAGESVPDHLSFLYESSLALDPCNATRDHARSIHGRSRSPLTRHRTRL